MPRIEADREPQRQLVALGLERSASSTAGRTERARSDRQPRSRFVGSRASAMLGALASRVAMARMVGEIARERKQCRHALRALAHRLPPYRRRAHGLVQLALRAPSRRQVPAPDRGHRQGALDPARRSTRSSTACAGSGSTGTARPISSPNSPPATPRSRAAARRRPRLSLLDDARRSWPRSARRRSASAARSAPRSPWRDPRRAPRRALRRAAEGAAGGRDRDRRPGSGPGRRSRMKSSTISSCSARTAARPTCSRWWSTITTWASPM